MRREPPPPQGYRALATHVRDAGLLDRRARYYTSVLTVSLGVLVGGWTLVVVLRSSWAVVGIAALLGCVATQLGFLGHDAGHRQICATARGNRLFGLIVGDGLVGLSFGWWVPKHNAHHAHPNEPGRDPDIGPGFVGSGPAPERSPGSSGLAGWMERRQALLFLPLMLLRSTGLYVSGVQDLYRRRDRGAAAEGLVLAARAVVYVGAVFWVLSPLKALAFLAIYEAVFSVYLGFSFAPNHKGMPMVDEGCEMGFAWRQVTTARNLTGGRWTALAFGGLNYQIEHHLFPTMPRPNLARAQSLVRQFCSDNGLAYCEASPVGALRRILGHLRAAGAAQGVRAPHSLH